MSTYRRQPTVRDRRGRVLTRIPMGTAILESIERHIERDRRRFAVDGIMPSRAFVIATILAYHYDVAEQPKADEQAERARRANCERR